MSNLSDPFSQISFLLPWEQTTARLELELEKEISPNHPLFGHEVVVIARRIDTDDVLFYIPNSTPPLAEVHLTWKGSTEKNPQLPWTTFYDNVSEWVEKSMKRDHSNYLESSQE
jgi:hypothetical protein